MKFDKKSTELNAEQKKAVKSLEENNDKIIKQVKIVLKDYNRLLRLLDSEMETFWSVMKALEQAHSHYPFGHFTNYYYKNLEEPAAESFLSEFGEKNQNYHPITKEKRDEIEKRLPNYKKYDSAISDNLELISSLVEKSIANNVFVLRIPGISEKYHELKELNRHWRYPRELAQSEYGVKGGISYDPHLPIKIPYHRQIIIKYHTIHNTASILKVKMNELVGILETINSYLPFAELMPIEKVPQTIVNVETNANNNPISIGDKNEFMKDTTIGQGGKIEQ